MVHIFNGTNQIKNPLRFVESLNIRAYRFSIAWSRILPKGIVDPSLPDQGLNMKGTQFYNNLIDELLQNNIEPWITLFHWDLPQYLEVNCGGWLVNNPQQSCNTIDAFVEYARIVFSTFGDRVKHFITINEAWTV